MRNTGPIAALLACLLSACATPDRAPEVDLATSPASVVVAAPTIAPEPIRLVSWHAPVEALFVHPLVLRPKLAFAAPDGGGFRDYFVTAREFRRLLEELWRNGWTFVDVHKAAAGTVRVPAGRKPLVLYEDDANYYRYFRGHGLARRLVLDPVGRVRAELQGGALTTADVVPLVEEAIAAHPELSAEGAKGVLAVTGFEGVLGVRHVVRHHAQLRALAHRLRRTGWTFASHTYGHIDLSSATPASVRADTARWRALTRRTLGTVDVVVYPYGARPAAAVRATLVRLGFPIQVDIDIRARRRHLDGATVLSRRHVDGLAFDVPRRQRQFYDVAVVRDPRRP